MRRRLLFIGEFPPPYTGVTVKDSLLCESILDDYDIERFDLYGFKNEKYKFLALAIKLMLAIKRADRICVGVGHPFRTCIVFYIARMLRGYEFLNQITVFMMGVRTPEYLKAHPVYIKYLAKGLCIFTESETLVNKFIDLGCMNACYLPNFRKEQDSCIPRPVGEVVRFVYFAQIRREKGFDTLVKASKYLNEQGYSDKFNVSVYGSIVDGYEDEFERLVSLVPNMQYKGAFDTAMGGAYKELNQYDSAASSSSWPEGMSGSNIEFKFSGIANIVSDAGFNSECVTNGVDGILVKPRDVKSLAAAMKSMIENHEMLQLMKEASFKSRIQFSAEKWKPLVLEKMNTAL